MTIDWEAVSGAASAAASIVAVASIGLAYRGVRVSRDSSILDRRTYLDGVFVRWVDSVDALDVAALPFLRHVPVQSELDAGSPDLPDAYKDFHRAFMQCRTATNLLESTGLFTYREKNGHVNPISSNEIVDVFKGVLWAYYFSVTQFSPAEVAGYSRNQGLVQDWRTAIQEVEDRLKSEGVSVGYFPIFEAAIKRLYPETSPLSVWQASDRLLHFCRAELAIAYLGLVDSRFPWNRGSRGIPRKETVANPEVAS